MQMQFWVRVAKTYLLINNLFITLLGIVIFSVSLRIYFDDHFTVLQNVYLPNNNFKGIHSTALYGGLAVSMVLTFSGMVCTAGLIQESRRYLAMGYFCLATLFCATVQLGYWRYTHGEEVGNIVKDIYDFLYYNFTRNKSTIAGKHLEDIHSVYVCCGKCSSFSPTCHVEDNTCPDTLTGVTEDCLVTMADFVMNCTNVQGMLILFTTIFTINGMMPAAFLYFCFQVSFPRRRTGKYTLATELVL
ncbi:tetraspanin-32-like isoform X1 [Polypterus senegalus]|uniref:tetraspanin-32-like isoform X1 n=1 Tax=Polypterus senegalus TaxID=55291 RepID=UPI001966B2F8|nr:tetraspanin-32-like isoform X1 [Polypterus senegalus]